MLRGILGALPPAAQVRRLALALTWPMVSSIFVTAYPVTPPPKPAASAYSRAVSGTQISALRSGAHEYPYATLALLEVLLSASTEQSGTLYFQSTPAAVLVSRLIASEDEAEIEILLAEALWNPYSDSSSAIQVQWAAQPLQGGATLLRFRTNLIITAGDAPLAPLHPLLEPPVGVLLTPDGVRFIGPAAETGACLHDHASRPHGQRAARI